jgi:hypothetical protein
LRTLAAYRGATEGGVAFGGKFSVLRPDGPAVGDDVTLTSWDDSRLLPPERHTAVPPGAAVDRRTSHGARGLRAGAG